MRKLVRDASSDADTIAQVADSPATFWNVQRNISIQKEARGPWPSRKFWRAVFLGAPVAAAVLAAAALFVVLLPEGPLDRGTNMISLGSFPASTTPPSTITQVDGLVPVNAKQQRLSHRSTATSRQASRAKPKLVSTEKRSEIKTDFIALSYAPQPESGQIVRVKVPRLMMVTAGLVSTVEKPGSLIDAEVVLGDDGQTHAIRFIKF